MFRGEKFAQPAIGYGTGALSIAKSCTISTRMVTSIVYSKYRELKSPAPLKNLSTALRSH
jgi:hypothetical protein